MHRPTSRLLCFLVVLMSGCTFASIGGRFVDWYAMKKLNDYFDLTSQQEEYLEPRVKGHIAWLKKVELPQVNQDLADLVKRVEVGLKEEDVAWLQARLDRLKNSLHLRIRDDAVWLLSRLEKSQIDHIAEKSAKRRERWADKLEEETPKEYRQSRLEKYEEAFEDWFGSITDEQTVQLHELYGDLADVKRGALYLAGSLEAQGRFLGFVTPPTSKKSVESMVTAWVDDPSALRTGKNREDYRARHQMFFESLLSIDQMITDKQREHLIKKIQSQRKNIAAFARAPG